MLISPIFLLNVPPRKCKAMHMAGMLFPLHRALRNIQDTAMPTPPSVPETELMPRGSQPAGPSQKERVAHGGAN